MDLLLITFPPINCNPLQGVGREKGKPQKESPHKGKEGIRKRKKEGRGETEKMSQASACSMLRELRSHCQRQRNPSSGSSYNWVICLNHRRSNLRTGRLSLGGREEMGRSPRSEICFASRPGTGLTSIGVASVASSVKTR